MLNSRKIVAVLPAFNAEKTLPKVYHDIPFHIVDEVILVDDCSSDETVKVATNLGIKHIIRHDKNKGYGGNQKTCYAKALELQADIVVMLHPDYQYTPKLIPSLCQPITLNVYDTMLASRILSRGALEGGMPLYKYFFNRMLTFMQNLLMQQKLSEYHTGFRAFSREVLETLPLEKNSDDFVFDNQMLAQIFFNGFTIGEISCPTKYFKEASSINFKRSLKYGVGVLCVSLVYFLQKRKLIKHSFLNE
jgi:glycosyltransferase involved in cell wall biosynthesis